MKRFFAIIIFLLFSFFIIWVMIGANRGNLGPAFEWAYHIPWFDKIGHFVLMGILAFLAVIAFVPGMTGTRRQATKKVISILLLLIALEEGSQYFIPKRTFSIPDFLFGLAGVLISIPFAWRWLKYFPSQKKGSGA